MRATGLVLALLLVSGADGASLRRRCRQSCANRVAACVATSGKLRKCRARVLRACKKQGLAYCATTTTVPVTTTTLPANLPPLSYRIDPSVAPSSPTLPDGRPLAAVQGDGGSPSVFIANEVLIAPRDRAELDAFLARTGGVVVSDNAVPPPPPGITLRSQDTAPTEFVVRLNPNHSDLSSFASDAATAGIGGPFAISSEAGARLLALATHEHAGGHKTGPNFVFEGAYLNSTQEHPDGVGGYLDAFGYSVFSAAGSKSDVVDAWRLVVAKPPPRRSRVAIIDGGFWLDSQGRPMSTGTGSDLPLQPAQWDFVGNDAIADGVSPSRCTGGSTCNWHGNGAAGAATGILNNKYGAPGTGGQVADPILLEAGLNDGSTAAAIRTAVQWGADVISMSFGGECNNSFCDLYFESVGLYPAMRNAWANGVVMVAAAGNGRDVGSGIFRGYDTHSVPCRGDHVICVGALANGATTGIGYSNFGRFVDIWAPTNVPVMPDGDNGAVHSFGGTSAATPFIAGIAAILKAYDRTLNSDDVDGILWQTAGHDSPDPNVGAYVNAFKAVRHVAGSTPPEIQVLAPAPNATVDIDSLGGVEFRAQATDLEDGPNCCTVRWHSLKDGAMGEGATIRFQFPDLGVRLITAEVEDSEGGTNFVNLAVNVVESPPSVVIDQPHHADHLYEDTPVTLSGRDLGLGLCQANAHNGKWTSSEAADVIPAYGCTVSATFHGLGVRFLTFTVTGPHGVPGSTSIAVTIDPKPAVVASIVAPSASTAINVDNCDDVLLDAYATGATPLTLTWTWQADQFGCDPFSMTVSCPFLNILCTIQPPSNVTHRSFWLSCGPPAPPCIGPGKIKLQVTDALSQTNTAEVAVSLVRNPH